MVSLDYDMEDEMKRVEKKISKVLDSFADVEGLEDVLSETSCLYDSEPFNYYTKNADSFFKNYMRYNEHSLDLDSLNENFSIVRDAMVLKKSKIKLIYVPSLWSDIIVLEHFELILTFCLNILCMKKSIGEIAPKDAFFLTEKLMSLGYDFDKNVDFVSISEDFFKNLKKIKWDKRAEKLFEKVFSIHGDMIGYIIAEFFSSLSYNNISNNRFILTFLAACCAVNDGRSLMVVGDVVMAFRTFYKLFDVDVDDLI